MGGVMLFKLIIIMLGSSDSTLVVILLSTDFCTGKPHQTHVWEESFGYLFCVVVLVTIVCLFLFSLKCHIN